MKIVLFLPVLWSCRQEQHDRQRIEALVYIAEAGGNLDVYMRDAAAERRRAIAETPAAEYIAAVSPQSRLAVIATRDSAGHHLEQLLLIDVQSGRAEAPVPQSGRLRNPVFSSDGQSLYFEADYASFRDIYAVELRTRRLRRLTHTEQGSFEPALSPDNTQLAFVSSVEGNAEIYVMTPPAEPVRLTAFHRNDTSPRWSRDGKQLAFLSDREGVERVFIMNPNGTGQRRLAAARASIEAEADPVWSPTQDAIAFARLEHGRWGIYLFDLAANTERRLSPDYEDARHPAFSLAGDRVAYSSTVNGRARLAITSLEGTNVHLSAVTAAEWLPRWVEVAWD